METKVVIPTRGDGEIDNHFGHCEFFTIFTVDTISKKVISLEKMPSPQGCGCKSNIANTFAELGVTVMLAGGIGDGAVQKLSHSGIKVIKNCGGKVDQLIKEFLFGILIDHGDTCFHRNCH